MDGIAVTAVSDEARTAMEEEIIGLTDPPSVERTRHYLSRLPVDLLVGLLAERRRNDATQANCSFLNFLYVPGAEAQITNGCMIHRIKIKDFKSIRDVDLEFDPVTVLVGRSGTGKSNIVQAIRFLRNLQLNAEQAILHEFDWSRILPTGVATPRPSIEVLFSVPGEEDKYTYFVQYGKNPHSGQILLSEERLRLAERDLFHRRRAASNNYNWLWEKEPETKLGLMMDTPILNQFPSLQKVVFANAALSNGIGYYHFPSTALTRMPNPSSNAPIAQLPGLLDDGSNYKNVIRAITQDFHHPKIRKNILASLKQVDPSIESVELDSLVNPQNVIVGHKADNWIFSLSLEQESDGLRRFYAHLLALYQTPSKLTLVFEEPENAIFPGALSLLADEFKAAPRESRGQVIITTHSPNLLDNIDVDNVRVVDMSDGKTVVGRVSSEQRQAVKDNLLNTGELLTVDIAKVEGKAQEIPQ